ncbi:amino acid permease, partial [Bacillus cereus]
MGTGLDAKSGHERASLRQALRMRHMTMISLGGVIGAGLFVGSGAVIQTTGPAAVVSYALAGFLVILIMRMLGEMATARPAVGSFAEYGRMALGEWAGFLMGWLYWYF